MARRRSDETRFFGPYKHGDKYRLQRRDAGGESTWIPYDTKEEALRAKRAAERKIATSGKTIEEAVTAYLTYLQHDKESAPNTIKAQRLFLAALFPIQGETLGEVGPDHYAELRKRPGRKPGSTCAAATHRRGLAAGQTFLDWCVEKGWLKQNPLGKVKPMGKPRRGKTQLTIDEARRWIVSAYRLAHQQPGALGALCCCLLALRTSEVLSRAVRDLDNGGKVLWAQGKGATEATPINLQGADLAELRELLQRAARGKLPLAPLIDTSSFGITYWNRKICAAAGVPVVCPHSLRGLHSTVALEQGQTAAVVARTLRHSERIDREAYARPGAEAEGQRRRFLRIVGTDSEISVPTEEGEGDSDGD